MNQFNQLFFSIRKREGRNPSPNLYRILHKWREYRSARFVISSNFFHWGPSTTTGSTMIKHRNQQPSCPQLEAFLGGIIFFIQLPIFLTEDMKLRIRDFILLQLGIVYLAGSGISLWAWVKVLESFEQGKR